MEHRVGDRAGRLGDDGLDAFPGPDSARPPGELFPGDEHIRTTARVWCDFLVQRRLYARRLRRYRDRLDPCKRRDRYTSRLRQYPSMSTRAAPARSISKVRESR